MERGIVEVYSSVSTQTGAEQQTQEFIIDVLQPGCSINARAYITQDSMAVNFRAKKDCRLLNLERKIMDDIIHNYEYGNNIGVFEAKILKMEQKFLLDYGSLKSKDDSLMLQLSLKNRFKNVIMLIVNEIRIRRKLPTLIKFLQIYQKQSHLPNAKEEFQKKFKMLYGDDVESEDKKFDELTRTYDRVQKTISQQHRTLDFLVKKVN